MKEIVIPLIAAIASPIIFGFMNVFDKTIVSHKVKKPLTYTSIAGLINLFIGIILAIFLDWEGITLNSMIFPVLAGILFGVQFYLYFIILSKEDISHIIGILYIYPIIVAFLSLLFLNEILSIYGYIGMFLILAGVLMLSGRLKKIKLKVGVWMLIMMILTVGFSEFFIKIATNNLPELNGLAINSIFIGLTIIPVLLFSNVRKHFKQEIKNFKWAFISEVLTFLGLGTLYFAMKGMPATVVSSLSATQPLAVLFFEKIFHKFGADICRDVNLWAKLIPIVLIVIGVILLYVQEIFGFLT